MLLVSRLLATAEEDRLSFPKLLLPTPKLTVGGGLCASLS
jgi:hypothetical protein